MVNIISWRNRPRGEMAEAFPLTTLRTEMDRLFDAFIREPLGAMGMAGGDGGTWLPPVDIVEGEKDVTIRAELPGIDPKDLKVSIQGNQLELAGEKKECCETKDKTCYRSESRYGAFQRTIELPEGLDTEKVNAQYSNGVLTLTLKKTPQSTPKRIEVAVK